MSNEEDAGVYYWHSLTGATSWDHPGEAVWRECRAPDLHGRKIYSWAPPPPPPPGPRQASG